MYVGNGIRAAVAAIGTFDLVLPLGLILVLNNCHYAPSIVRGVVSVSFLLDNGFVHAFINNGISVSLNNVFYFNAIPINGVFEIDMENSVSNRNNFVYSISNKRIKSNLDSSYLWHCLLAHIGKDRMEKLQHDGLLQKINDESFDKCESCISGKMTRKPFSHQVERATELLGLMCLVNLDMCQNAVIATT